MSDRKLSRSNLEVQLGGLEAAIQYYAENATPQLIILETDGDADNVLQQLDSLAEVCDAGTNVLVIGQANDILLYRELIRRGVSDYLVHPLAPRDIYESVAGIFIDPDSPPAGRALAFMGARGGAGSSTMAHNVAWLLSDEFQEEVSVIDLDITFGTAALAFNIETQQHIDQALADPSRLDDVLLDRFLVEYDENLRLLVAPATLNAEEKIVTDSLDRLLDLVRRRSSFVILDVPHRWAPWVQQVLLDADETVITGVMDLSGLRDTRNLVERLKQQRGDSGPVRVVLNHAGAYKRTELSPKDFENALEVEPDLIMPHDPVLFGTAGNNGQMIGEFNPRHKAVENLRAFSLGLSGRQPAQRKKKSVFDNFSMLKLKRA